MTNASQLPDLSKVPVDVAKADAASPLPGFVTFAHLAARVGITPNHLRVSLSDEDAPKLVPSFRIGTANLYSEHVADQWFAKFQEWRDSAALRAATRKREQEQRVLRKLEEEQKQLRAKSEILAAHRQATEESLAAIEVQRKADDETHQRIARLSGRG
ncbi:hypothetical protein [Variovorax sp. YR566]|uniref:hypothetical protein n=1 Tax=Variovorax sp. YR566 TaxID=3450237 RepID=UPI003F7D2CEF